MNFLLNHHLKHKALIYCRSYNDLKSKYPNDFHMLLNIINHHEENLLISVLEQSLRRKSYDDNHWDSVITKYKEIELLSSRKISYQAIEPILQRIRDQISYTIEKSVDFLVPHAIDLADNGFIDPHVDSIKFSGELIAGLSLMTPRTMRLTLEKEYEVKYDLSAEKSFDILLEPRSLYILKGPLRYDYNHSVLLGSGGRRLSVIFRDTHPNDIFKNETK